MQLVFTFRGDSIIWLSCSTIMSVVADPQSHMPLEVTQRDTACVSNYVFDGFYELERFVSSLHRRGAALAALQR